VSPRSAYPLNALPGPAWRRYLTFFLGLVFFAATCDLRPATCDLRPATCGPVASRASRSACRKSVAALPDPLLIRSSTAQMVIRWPCEFAHIDGLVRPYQDGPLIRPAFLMEISIVRQR
jgi:hypothetical protein